MKMAQTSRNNLQVYNSLNEYAPSKNINIVEPITEVSPRIPNKRSEVNHYLSSPVQDEKSQESEMAKTINSAQSRKSVLKKYTREINEDKE